MERDELKFTDIELYNISQSILTRYQMIPDESQNEQYNLWELYKKVQAEIIRRNVMAADVQEVIRCKDCIYWQDNNDGYPHPDCKWNTDETPDADDFCSAGERKV